MRLDLRQRRARGPDHPLRAQPGRHELGQDRRRRALAGKYENQPGDCQCVIPGRTISSRSRSRSANGSGASGAAAAAWPGSRRAPRRARSAAPRPAPCRTRPTPRPRGHGGGTRRGSCAARSRRDSIAPDRLQRCKRSWHHGAESSRGGSAWRDGSGVRAGTAALARRSGARGARRRRRRARHSTRARRRPGRTRAVRRAGGRERRHTGELLSARATGDIASYDPDRRGDEQRAAYTLTGEASGRDAVRLDRGEHVEFTLTRPTNAITVRYSIPDAPQGGGIARRSRWRSNGRRGEHDDADVGVRVAVCRLPFSNDPQADWLHPDWWRPPTETQDKPHRPEPLLRRAAPAARQDLPGRRQAAAHGARRRDGRLDRDRPARLRARRGARSKPPRRGARDSLRRRPVRAARLVRGLRRRDRVRQAPRQAPAPSCGSPRAPSR